MIKDAASIYCLSVDVCAFVVLVDEVHSNCRRHIGLLSFCQPSVNVRALGSRGVWLRTRTRDLHFREVQVTNEPVLAAKMLWVSPVCLPSQEVKVIVFALLFVLA